jgi:hypothetical protein
MPNRWGYYKRLVVYIDLFAELMYFWFYGLGIALGYITLLIIWHWIKSIIYKE